MFGTATGKSCCARAHGTTAAITPKHHWGPFSFLVVAGIGCYLLYEALRAMVLRQIPCVGKGCAGQIYTLAEHADKYWANLFFVVWMVVALAYAMYVTFKLWTRP